MAATGVASSVVGAATLCHFGQHGLAHHGLRGPVSIGIDQGHIMVGGWCWGRRDRVMQIPGNKRRKYRRPQKSACGQRIFIVGRTGQNQGNDGIKNRLPVDRPLSPHCLPSFRHCHHQSPLQPLLPPSCPPSLTTLSIEVDKERVLM